MNELNAIEAINFEQLVTATDRLLLRGRFPRQRASSRGLIASPLGRSSTRGSADWRTFTYLALITGVFSVAASIASLL